MIYPKARCPQRIINEAIRLLEERGPSDDPDTEEATINNLIELEALAKALPHKMEF